METHCSHHSSQLSDAMQKILKTRNPETEVQVIVQGHPLTVARLQAALEAIEPGLGTHRGLGIMDGDCQNGRVLLYWSLIPSSDPSSQVN
ncbi:MAG: hypothetical protein HGA65_06735 [Oscillochloris sp.]|nr:hypothetical protein [Oscillochloris sp.]